MLSSPSCARSTDVVGDLLDDRREIQAASVRVAGQGAAQAQAIGAGLLLIDAPLRTRSVIRAIQPGDQLRPLDAAFDRDDAARRVERVPRPTAL